MTFTPTYLKGALFSCIFPRWPAFCSKLRSKSSMEVMDQKCTVQHIAKIAKFLPEWKTVATLLGFEQAIIRDIGNESSDDGERRYEMLTRWVVKEGCQATYRKIYDTLLYLDLKEPAEKVLELIGVLPPMQSPPPAPSTQRQESLGPPTLKLLMNFPTQEGTINIIQEIGVAYSKLGIFLLNDKNGNRIAALQHEHHHNAEDITMAMFQTWFREGTKISITWNTLVTALGNASLNSLADKIAKAVFQTPPSVEPPSALCPEPNMPSKKAKKKELGPKYEVKPVEVEPDEVEPDEEEPDEVEPDGGDEDESRVSLGGNSAHVGDAYTMKTTPHHGIALIISNTEFEKGLDLDDRNPGGKADEENLKQLFETLKYKVVMLTNLKMAQIELAFQIVTKTKNYQDIVKKQDRKFLENLKDNDNLVSDNHDSFICCLMSHGEENVIYGIDGEPFIINSIYHFLGDGCAALKSKPKMVFVQACRGDETAQVEPLPRDGVPKSDGPRNVADFLLSFPTFNGHSAFRDDSGSWYMEALCSIFSKNYKKHDVLKMITAVHRKVTERMEAGQVPIIHSSLRCMVHF